MIRLTLAKGLSRKRGLLNKIRCVVILFFLWYNENGDDMLYIIMCAGEGKRWGNYLGVPKHLVEINGETLLERTTRLLKENGITNYLITGNDERYKQYGELVEQSCNDCEIDRFDEKYVNGEVCYLYGDVYYSDYAIKKIIGTETNDILFFGSNAEIFAIKVKDTKTFYEHKHKVKELYLKNELDRCIGWEIYRSYNSIPFGHHVINNHFCKILDETDDIDYPQDFERFKNKIERKIKLTLFIPVYNQEKLVIRALDSIPKRDDIEILIIDDGSTDNTYNVCQDWMNEHSGLNIRIIKNEVNIGLGSTKNVAYDNAKGEYINELDSDDYLYTEDYNRIVDMLDGTDIVYMNLKKNDNSIFDITKENQRGLCSGCARFIRKEFLGDTRCRPINAGEDWYLNEELQQKPHTDKFTRLIGYHYNFPREGSLYDKLIKGEI